MHYTRNVKALSEATTPRTQTELRSFLGMCNVYRRFVTSLKQRRLSRRYSERENHISFPRSRKIKPRPSNR